MIIIGTWGVGIFQNDVADEVRNDYKSKLKLGKSDKEALMEVIDSSTSYIYEDDDKYDFWFGLASIMVDLGRLTDEVRDIALQLIDDSSGDIKRWERASDIKKRKAELEKLKSKLIAEQPSRKKIQLAKPYVCPWQKNDIFVYQLNSDFYKNTEWFGKYLIILVDEIVNHDVVVPNLGDMLPVTYIKLSEKYPLTPYDIEAAKYISRFPFINKQEREKEYRYMWYRQNFKRFTAGFEYWGQYDFTRAINSNDPYKYRIMSHFYAGIGMFWARFDEIVLKNLHLEIKHQQF